MNHDWDMLYITFIDFDNNRSGSSVRPVKMYEAFKNIGLKVKLLEGQNNNRKKRKRNVKEILRWLKTNRPKICYIEPPSGPFFCSIDLYLMLNLKRLNIPIGLFYRDAYWMFPDLYASDMNKLKMKLIEMMSKRDLAVFKKTCAHLFFPSKTMIEELKFDMECSDLPPGCVFRDIDDMIEEDNMRIRSAPILTYFYVGGVSKYYGTKIMLNAFKDINKDKRTADLICVCREDEWHRFFKEEDYINQQWLKLYHVSGDEKLSELYKKADICVLSLLKSTYMDFAVPIKTFEYMSYGKPILSTSCNEIQRIIESNNMGWVVCDNEESMKEKIMYLCTSREEIMTAKKNSIAALSDNTWEKRAQTVVDTLHGYLKDFNI
ncbi:MAG: glycosyltransferase [Oscillospiraceae bacterium]|jgi:glycosyltransferase involved in cell wall biosynthesis|nr:glycosyltransferase [Oscillospiraceae bacterium]